MSTAKRQGNGLQQWKVQGWKLKDLRRKWDEVNKAWVYVDVSREPMKASIITAIDGVSAASTYARCNQISKSDWWQGSENKVPRIVIRTELQGHVQNVDAKAQHWGRVGA